MSAAKNALKAEFVSTKNEVMIMSNVLKESTADSVNAAIDVVEIASVASNVKFTNDTSQRAANDTSMSGDLVSVGPTHTTEESRRDYYKSFIRNVIDKRFEYDCLISRHNECLYEILEGCYTLSQNVEMNDENSILRKTLEAFRTNSAIKSKKTVQKHSANEHIIIRLVFEESNDVAFDSPTRHMVSTYAIALRNAKSNNVAINDFAKWVRSVGGLDKARRLTHKKRDESKTEKSSEENSMVNEQTSTNEQQCVDTLLKQFSEWKLEDDIASGRIIDNSYVIDDINEDELFVLVARKSTESSFVVLRVSRATSNE